MLLGIHFQPCPGLRADDGGPGAEIAHDKAQRIGRQLKVWAGDNGGQMRAGSYKLGTFRDACAIKRHPEQVNY